MFNPVAPYRYLLPNLYLYVVVGPGLVWTSPAFMKIVASHPAGLHGRLASKKVKSGERGRHNLHRVCQTTVTAPLRVGCVG